eukprot:5934981-Pleurochrysis_carterae.AAC.1
MIAPGDHIRHATEKQRPRRPFYATKSGNNSRDSNAAFAVTRVRKRTFAVRTELPIIDMSNENFEMTKHKTREGPKPKKLALEDF